ncbi:ketopantoate reductase family protein [Larkinella soli]|uniref:ketopantoate reductase family protein n=1 Tax=Larkinella soli TaxID=1770527 RepID=UPI000FFC69EE|nr:2-dehydropantoate 2-reductase [Larkinella soli]
MEDRIFIIGAGAVGRVLAVFLKRAGREVVLLRGSVDGLAATTETVQVAFPDGTELEAEVDIATLSHFPALDGLVVLTSKSYGNEGLARSLGGKIGRSPVVLLQNGLGVEKPFVEAGFPEVYRCVLFTTSQTVSDTRLSFKPVAVSPVGIVRGNEPTLNRVVETLRNPHLTFRAEADIRTVSWKKAVTNCVFNSICPLLEVDNGIFHRSPEVLALARRVIGECVEVANAAGVALNADEVTESLLLISRSSDGQLISTLQDIRNGRPTEIETLNLEVARVAESLNLGHRVSQTRLLGELTKLKSDLSRTAQPASGIIPPEGF